MRSTVACVCLTAAIVLLGGAPRSASAQEPPPDDTRQNLAQVAAAQNQAPPAGYLSAIEGAARVDREGALTDAERGLPLIGGDRLRTDAGRLEITLTDGSRIHLDRFSEIELPSELVVRLARGRLLVSLKPGVRDRISVEAPGALARFDEDGQYRVAVGGDDVVDVELAVLRGSAELSSEGGAVRLGTGERARVRDGEAPTRAEMLASNPTTLERWADELTAANYQGGRVSQSYLPDELDSYAPSFDQYGTWQSDETYGSVWYPTVASDWRPYYNGRWDHMRSYGWTWVTADPWWGYPTHHYGRWQLSYNGSWFWIPSRHWGPAWVYWATTPSYVGWCPLGWNGHPVVNVFAYGGTGHRYGRGRDPYRAWTVLPASGFGRTHVPNHRIDRTVLDRDRPTFVMQHVPPGYAPPRSPYARSSQRADGGRGGPVRRPGGYVAPAARTNAGDGAAADTRVTDPGWSNYREYERRMRAPQTGRDASDSNTDSTKTSGWANYREYERRTRDQQNRQNDGDNAGDRSPGYARPTDPGGRPDSGRPNRADPDTGRSRPGYVAPPTGQAAPRSGGGSRGGSVAPPSSGGNEARRGGSGGDGGASRSGGGNGSTGTAAPRRRP